MTQKLETLDDLFAIAEAEALESARQDAEFEKTPAGQARLAARLERKARQIELASHLVETQCGLCGEDLNDESMCPHCDSEES